MIASLDINVEDTLEPLSLGHRCMAFGRCTNFNTGDSLRAFATFGWCNEATPAVVGRQHTVVTSGVDSRFWY